jgi:hypothetical protein
VSQDTFVHAAKYATAPLCGIPLFRIDQLDENHGKRAFEKKAFPTQESLY